MTIIADFEDGNADGFTESSGDVTMSATTNNVGKGDFSAVTDSSPNDIAYKTGNWGYPNNISWYCYHENIPASGTRYRVAEDDGSASGGGRLAYLCIDTNGLYVGGCSGGGGSTDTGITINAGQMYYIRLYNIDYSTSPMQFDIAVYNADTGQEVGSYAGAQSAYDSINGVQYFGIQTNEADVWTDHIEYDAPKNLGRWVVTQTDNSYTSGGVGAKFTSAYAQLDTLEICGSAPAPPVADFESGDLSEWTGLDSGNLNDWTVATDYAYKGDYGAQCIQNDAGPIEYNWGGVTGPTRFSYWMKLRSLPDSFDMGDGDSTIQLVNGDYTDRWSAFAVNDQGNPVYFVDDSDGNNWNAFNHTLSTGVWRKWESEYDYGNNEFTLSLIDPDGNTVFSGTGSLGTYFEPSSGNTASTIRLASPPGEQWDIDHFIVE